LIQSVLLQGFWLLSFAFEFKKHRTPAVQQGAIWPRRLARHLELFLTDTQLAAKLDEARFVVTF